jgi:hypothetical protein
MKRTVLSFSFFLFVSAVLADVLIERSTQTVRLTGQNVERTLNFSGYVISDLDGTNGAAIRTITLGGRRFYEVSRDSTPVFSTTVQGLNGREFRVIAHASTESNKVQTVKVDALLVKGANAALQVSDARQIIHPRVLRGSASRVEFNDGQYRVSENTITRTYLQTETRTANARGEDVEMALTRIVQRLEATGYSPLE